MASSARTPFSTRRDANFGSLLRSGASLLAVCAFATATPGFAQSTQNGGTGPQSGAGTAGNTQQSGQNGGADNGVSNSAAPDTGDQGTIVVTGIRQSLANSQSIKRNSDTIVDAITASDIGALPDRSVTEALQRVPGVDMNRFAGSNDPDHFSVEGSGVVIRGLNFVRSEFNGRDTFSAGVYGQAINFADVPAELLGSVEVYKNATASMIEGGLAGTVNLNTRLPLDNKGFHVSFDMEGNYGDMRKRLSPTGSFLISDTFDTGIGRIGLLADVSYSEILSRADGVQVTNYQTRDNLSTVQADTQSVAICRNPLPSNTDVAGFAPQAPTPPPGQACTGPQPAGANGYADNSPLQYAPLGGQFRTEDYDRQRTGIAAAAQWESLDRRASLTAQFLRTDSKNNWGEHTFESAPDLSDYDTYPYGCLPNSAGPQFTTTGQTNAGTTIAECPTGNFTSGPQTGQPKFQNYQYNSNGVFEKGYITLPGAGWRSQDSGGTWRTPTGGIQQSLSDRQVSEENIVTDYGLNFKFKPNSHWNFNFDGDYTTAVHNDLDVSVFGSNFADEYLDLTGNIPVIVPHKPLWLSATWAGGNCPAAAAGQAYKAQCTPNTRIQNENDQQYFSDPGNTFWRAAMDHIEHSTGHEWSFKNDSTYSFDPGSFLNSIKFGARYADREETVRYTTYNWGRLSETWNGTGPVWMDQTPASDISWYSFPNFFRGETAGPPGGYYYNGNLIQGYDQASTFFQSVEGMSGNANGAWTPLSERAGVIPGTPFLPSEIQEVGQKSTDAYAQLNFGGDEPIIGGIKLSGNIGLRYVNTRVSSAGSIFITRASLGVDETFAQRCMTSLVPPAPPPGAPPGAIIGSPGGICLLGQAYYNQLQQFASGAATPTQVNTNDNKFMPSLNLKFALSRDLIARFAASRVMTLPDLASLRNSFSASFNATDNSITFNLGNPNLRPATADQFDVTLEWYFARVGSLTFDAFYKRIHNFFFAAQENRNFTQNGITEPIDVRIPENYSGTGEVKGVEVAYEQTFDFLPWILNGLGVNASYTYLQSQGLPNSFLNTGSPDASTSVGTGHLPLEQLSKHTVNVQAFYEKGPVSLRVAYNWRSKFLLTSADVIFPYYPIYNAATGSVDASAFINVSKQVKIGVQAVNLTNTVTKTLQQFTASGLLGPRSYYMNDRRFSFIIRGSF